LIKGLWAAIAALLIVGVIGAATVSDDGEGTGVAAADVVANAAETMSQLSSSTFHMESHTTAQGQTFSFTMDGVQHPRDKRSSVTMDLPLPGGASQMKIVTDGNDAYMFVPPQSRSNANGKTWVLFDASSFTPNGLGTDPSANLDLLKTANSEIKSLGRATIDGMATTHYRATVDPTALAERMPAMSAALGRIDLPEFPMDVWINGDGRVVQVREDFEVERVKFKMVMKFRDFGTAPPIEVPKSADAERVGSFEEAIAIVSGA